MNWHAKFLSAFLSLAFGSEVFAHGGRLDGLGCHNNKKKGSYHCHRGVLAGQEFPSRDNALNAKQPNQEHLFKPLKGTARVGDGKDVDHRNRNALDNRAGNLSLMGRAKNLARKRK